MKQNKRCIFHIPNHIDSNAKSGSGKRPIKMIEAFRNSGYIVDVIMGYGKERKKQIAQIKKNIKNGVKYDFLYSESSTMPTLLTEKNHLPIYPFLDFSFMKFCKKNGLKIGLFYRDIHWKFQHYKNDVPIWQRLITVPFYKYDLYEYRKILDYLYLASEEVKKYLPQKNVKTNKYKIDTLPPGCEKKSILEKNVDSNILNIFYVGGISEEVYNFKKLIEAVGEQKDIRLRICCRDYDWIKVKDDYKKYLTDNISIVHLAGEQLKECYREADVCSLLFDDNEYMKIAMPIKMFEYLSYNKPIIASNGTVAGKFVKENDIGWTIDYEENKIKELLEYLKNNRNEIEKIKENQKKVIEKNLWTERAKKVIKNLIEEGEN